MDPQANYLEYLERTCPVFYVPVENKNSDHSTDCKTSEETTIIKAIYEKKPDANGKQVLHKNTYYVDGSRSKIVQVLNNHVHTFVRTIYHFKHDIALALWSTFFTRVLEKPSTGTFGIYTSNFFGAFYGKSLYIPLTKYGLVKVIIMIPKSDWDALLNGSLAHPIRPLPDTPPL